MDKELIYVNLLSNNPKRLIDFYANVVGLEPSSNSVGQNDERWYGFNTGKAQFAIEPMGNRDKYKFEYNKGNPVLIQFRVDSLGALIDWTEKIEEAEVPIGQRVLKKSYGTVTTFVDPDGNVVELLYQENSNQ